MRRYDASDLEAVREHNLEEMLVDLADGDHANLAVVAAVVLEHHRSIQEHASREGETETALGLVLRALPRVEFDLHTITIRC